MGGLHDICYKLTPKFEIMLIGAYIIFNKIEFSEFLVYLKFNTLNRIHLEKIKILSNSLSS